VRSQWESVVYWNDLLFCQSSAFESHMIERGIKTQAHGDTVERVPAMRWLGVVLVRRMPRLARIQGRMNKMDRQSTMTVR
jgi:hypothetical protein